MSARISDGVSTLQPLELLVERSLAALEKEPVTRQRAPDTGPGGEPDDLSHRKLPLAGERGLQCPEPSSCLRRVKRTVTFQRLRYLTGFLTMGSQFENLMLVVILK